MAANVGSHCPRMRAPDPIRSFELASFQRQLSWHKGRSFRQVDWQNLGQAHLLMCVATSALFPPTVAQSGRPGLRHKTLVRAVVMSLQRQGQGLIARLPNWRRWSRLHCVLPKAAKRRVTRFACVHTTFLRGSYPRIVLMLATSVRSDSDGRQTMDSA